MENLALVLIETPANPTLQLADLPGIIAGIREVAPQAVIAVDNTLLGPVFQKVLPLGVDLAIFSATKMIGGHSDLIAGLVMGKSELIGKIKGTRTISGTMNDPHAAWLLSRSLETLTIRTEATEAKAKKVYEFLDAHSKVSEVYYPGFGINEEQLRRYAEQCTGHGALMSFKVKGGQKGAYAVLNALRVIKLAVSLGGTESLAEHPRTHTHADVSERDQNHFGITEDLVRLSVGLEHEDDLIADLDQALAQIKN
jgi:methionine-gamma-lyase